MLIFLPHFVHFKSGLLARDGTAGGEPSLFSGSPVCVGGDFSVSRQVTVKVLARALCWVLALCLAPSSVLQLLSVIASSRL